MLELSENAGDVRDSSTVTQLVDVMFREAGIEHKNEMTFEDFCKVFASREYASTLQAATLANQGTSCASLAQTIQCSRIQYHFIVCWHTKTKKKKAFLLVRDKTFNECYNEKTKIFVRYLNKVRSVQHGNSI